MYSCRQKINNVAGLFQCEVVKIIKSNLHESVTFSKRFMTCSTLASYLFFKNDLEKIDSLNPNTTVNTCSCHIDEK